MTTLFICPEERVTWSDLAKKDSHFQGIIRNNGNGHFIATGSSEGAPGPTAFVKLPASHGKYNDCFYTQFLTIVE
ncbi:MAG: hypothetical protein WCV55_01125 [Candidatus Paceibacterota bacterium]